MVRKDEWNCDWHLRFEPGVTRLPATTVLNTEAAGRRKDLESLPRLKSFREYLKTK